MSENQYFKLKAGIKGSFPIGNRKTLKGLQMTTTIIGIIITALAIESDKITHYQHYGFPLAAVVGILMVIISLAAD